MKEPTIKVGQVWRFNFGSGVYMTEKIVSIEGLDVVGVVIDTNSDSWDKGDETHYTVKEYKNDVMFEENGARLILDFNDYYKTI